MIAVVHFIPPANDASLRLTDCYILSDHNEFDTVCFLGVECGIFLLGQSKIEDISSIVPTTMMSGQIKSDKINFYLTMITVLGR